MNEDPNCKGCTTIEDCYWAEIDGNSIHCPCHGCLIKVLCEELCEDAIYEMRRKYENADKDL